MPLCKPQQRDEVLALCNVVETAPAFTLIRATTELIQRGRKLYRDRADKEWSLTDCISFVVMHDRGVSERLRSRHNYGAIMARMQTRNSGKGVTIHTCLRGRDARGVIRATVLDCGSRERAAPE